MAADPYTTLGVKKDATAAQIKSAYLKLAKKHHPDLNPGDAKAEEKFKAISAAHDLLGDPEKRARFDAGETPPARRRRRSIPAAGSSTAALPMASRAGATTRASAAAGLPARARRAFPTCSPICSQTPAAPAHSRETSPCAARTSATSSP